MFEFANGLLNPNRPVSVDDAVKKSNKVIEKLGKLGSDESVEHLQKVSSSMESLKNAGNAHATAIEKGVGIDSAKETLREAHKDAMKAIKSGKSHVRGAAYYRSGQRFGRLATNKFVAIPVLAVAGIAALAGGASFIGKKRDEKERESKIDLQNQQTESMKSDIAAMKSENTMMGMEPVVGGHASKVVAARNGAMGGVDATNPIMHSSPDGRPIEIVRS